MANIIYTKDRVEYTLEKAKVLTAEIRCLSTIPFAMNDNSIEAIIKECEYIIAGIYSLLNPKIKKFQFDKIKSDKDFMEYAEKYIKALEEDLFDIKNSKVFAG